MNFQFDPKVKINKQIINILSFYVMIIVIITAVIIISFVTHHNPVSDPFFQEIHWYFVCLTLSLLKTLINAQYFSAEINEESNPRGVSTTTTFPTFSFLHSNIFYILFIIHDIIQSIIQYFSRYISIYIIHYFWYIEKNAEYREAREGSNLSTKK